MQSSRRLRKRNGSRAASLALTASLGAAAAFAPLPAAATGTFTMAQVLSAPYVSGLAASPDGKQLVWKVHLRGLRNVYFWPGDGTPVRKLTAYDADDGQDIDELQIVPALGAVAYMRGGTEDNSGGDNVNPLLLVPPPRRSILMVPLAGGTPVEIGTGRDAVVSPRGDAVAWDGGPAGLMIASLAKDAAGLHASGSKHVELRGHAGQMTWSPDGSRLAFTETRGDHAFVAIYQPASGKLVYTAPDFTYDGYPAWSPDGTRVAFVRQPGAREDESPYLDPLRAPWSIAVADASTGSATIVWTAHRGMGSAFYPSDSRAQLWWLNGQTIAFPWEGTGWQNLYAVGASGGTPATPLATGGFEVETVVQSIDGASLLYATNENDVDHRHVWTVGLDAKPRALTAGPESQWAPTGMANGGYAYVSAGYNTVPTVYVAGGGAPAAIVAEPPPGDFPAADLVEPQLVTFRAKDGLVIHGQLFVPRDGAGKHPGLIFDHGGPVRQMLPGFHYMEAYTNLYESNQYFANHGFVVLSINYRSGIMYGHDFRMAKRIGFFGASEYQDVLAGARFLQARPDVDGKRLGIYGLSYGGYLTALALARNSDIFKAGADYAGVHNWATIIDEDEGKTLGTPAQRQVAYDASPIASLSAWRSPVFIAQGDDDRNVEFSQGVDLVNRLRDRGVEVQTMVFPNETHENQVWAHMVALYTAAADFLIAKLK